MEIFISILKILFVLSGIMLVVLVLLRKSEASSLGSAFGGMGDTAFGVKTQKHLDKIITWAFVIFIGTAILINLKTLRNVATKPTTTNTPPPASAPANPTPEQPTTPESKN